MTMTMTNEQRLATLREIATNTTTGTVEITVHSKGTKMDGIESISTSVLLNPICQHRQQCGGVCAHCYADTLSKCRTTLSERLARNTGRLTSHLLTDDEVPRFSTLYGRIESFGDVANITAARNYIKIIRMNPRTQFGIWSKNWGIWAQAFKMDGKPDNCTFVLSSVELDSPIDISDTIAPYVDHRFTVYTKTPEHVAESNCAGIRCSTCLKCYTKNDTFDIKEILR